MGRDFRFIFFTSKDILNNNDTEYEFWYDVSRHNKYMINGIFSYKDLKSKIIELVNLIDNEDEYDKDDEFNCIDDKDIAESISIASKILSRMSINQIVLIEYN